jgi:DNA-binding transcriptional MocR family regulator
MDRLPLESDLQSPSARTLAEAVSDAVRAGRLSAGDRLPPIRDVARQLGMSPTTVSAAWNLLGRSGTIATEGRRGTRISVPRRPGPARYRRAVDREAQLAFDISTGLPDPDLLPDLGRALAGIDSTFSAGSYLDAPIVDELEQLLRADWPYRPDRIVVVDGAMDGVELVSRSMLPAGSHVVVEDPCFPPLLDLLEARRIDISGVRLDAEGLEPAGLGRALKRPTSAIFLQPRGQNPTGVSMTNARAGAIAAAVAGRETLVIEDDSTALVSSSPPVSVGTWLPDQTVHLRSFSKSHGPDLRLAALSGSVEVIERLTALRQLGQGWSSRILQRLLLSLLSDPSSQQVVVQARERYHARRTAMVEHLAEHGIPVTGTDGFNLWLPVADETAAVMQAAHLGIGVAPGTPFMIAPADPHIRVTASSLADDVRAVGDVLVQAARSAPRIRA